MPPGSAASGSGRLERVFEDGVRSTGAVVILNDDQAPPPNACVIWARVGIWAKAWIWAKVGSQLGPVPEHGTAFG